MNIFVFFDPQKFDLLFDIHNSRSPWGKYSKAPLRVNSWSSNQKFLNEMSEYIPKLTDVSGVKLIETRRSDNYFSKRVVLKFRNPHAHARTHIHTHAPFPIYFFQFSSNTRLINLTHKIHFGSLLVDVRSHYQVATRMVSSVSLMPRLPIYAKSKMREYSIWINKQNITL